VNYFRTLRDMQKVAIEHHQEVRVTESNGDIFSVVSHPTPNGPKLTVRH
jgi:hypothetical protein